MINCVTAHLSFLLVHAKWYPNQQGTEISIHNSLRLVYYSVPSPLPANIMVFLHCRKVHQEERDKVGEAHAPSCLSCASFSPSCPDFGFFFFCVDPSSFDGACRFHLRRKRRLSLNASVSGSVAQERESAMLIASSRTAYVLYPCRGSLIESANANGVSQRAWESASCGGPEPVRNRG